MKRSLTIPVSALGLVLVACSGKLDLGGSDDGGAQNPLDGGSSTLDGPSPIDSGRGTSLDAASRTDSGSGPLTDGGVLTSQTWLAFDSNRGGNRGIYLMHPDGSGLLRLSALSRGTEVEASFSPDGTKLAFTATGETQNFDGGFPTTQIFIRNLVTGAISQLTSHPNGAHQATWSPDGSLVAYLDMSITTTSDSGPPESPAPGEADLYVINADGTNDRDLSGPVSGGGTVWYPYSYPATPAFTRDSKRVLFSASESIYSVAVNGSGMLEIAGGPTEGAETPAPSWDGTLAIFSKWSGTGEGLYTISSAGYPVAPSNYGSPTLLVEGTSPIGYRRPAWSASQVVAFEQVNGSVANIALVTGTTVATVAAGPNDDRNPTWAPPASPPFLPAGGTCPAGCTPLGYLYDCATGATVCDCVSGSPAQVPVTCEGLPGGGFETDAGTPEAYLCCN